MPHESTYRLGVKLIPLGKEHYSCLFI